MDFGSKLVPILMDGKNGFRILHNVGYRAPLESPDSQLSIGTRVMKNGVEPGRLYRKLWTNRTRKIRDPGISVFSSNVLEIG